MIFLGIIVSILMFSIIVVIHELGHFSAARIFGVKVEEFGIGIPPRAKKLFIDKKGTLFSLNWLPIGGFVRLKGENTQNLKNKNEKDALINVASYKQAIIILAGVFMNFLLAGIIFSLLFFVGVKPVGINTQIETQRNIRIIPTYEQAIESGFLRKEPGVRLTPVAESRAQQAGIQAQDILLQINESIIDSPEDMIQLLSKHAGTQISLTLQDGKQEIHTKYITPTEDGKIGSYVSENIAINQDFRYKYGFLSAIKYGFLETYNQTLLTFQGLGSLVTRIVHPATPNERQEAIQQVSGPIGIIDFISNALQAGVIFLLIIGAIISINLGVFNLLPIPALDGGRFVFIVINGIIQKAFGRKMIREKTEGIIHVFFFMLLIALSLLIMYNDVNKIINN